MLLRLKSKHACALVSYFLRCCVHPGIKPCLACSLRTACDPSRHPLGRWEKLLSNLCSASIPASTLSLCARVSRDRANMRHVVRLRGFTLESHMQADHTYRRAAYMGIILSRTVYTCCLFAALSHDGVHARSRWLHTSYLLPRSLVLFSIRYCCPDRGAPLVGGITITIR